MRDDDLFPLSLIERRFWLWEHLFPAARVASLGVRVELSGAVDVDAWREAYAAVARAPALRTRIVERDGAFLGRLGAPSALEIVEGATEAELERAFAEVIAAPYVADQDALFRGRLVRLSSTQAVLFIGVHHAMVDGWTLASAIPHAFGAALRGRPPQWDVARWFAARAASLEPDPSKVAADRAFFAERLRRFTALPYPTPKVPPPSSSGRAHEALVPVSSALLAQVDSVASTLGARPVHLWLATVMTELARASGRRDVLLGTTNANRPGGSSDDGLDERSIGCTVRSNLLCGSLPDGASFRDVVVAARAAVRDGLAHPDCVLEDLSQLGDDAPRASMVFNYLPIAAWADDLDGLVASSERLFAGGTGTTAAVSVNPKGSVPQLRIHLDADVFSADQAAHLGERIVAMLEAGLREPLIPMARMPRLLAHDLVAIERAQGRPESRSPVVGGTLGPLLAADFANDGGDTQRPALVHDDKVISRDELSARGRQLASRLVARGVGPGRFVVLQIHDPLLVMQAIVGVVWAGGAWVPTDVHSPPHRLESIVDACDAALILRDDDVVAMLTEAVDAAALEGPWAAPRSVDPVYAIFTSGSTGRPKGVILSHDAVVTQLQGRVGLGFPRVRSYLNFAPFFFDGCIEPLLWTLTTGGTLHVLDEEQRKDPLLVRRLLRERAITNTSAVPTLWSAVLEAEDAPLVDLEFVIVGGEALTVPLVKKHCEQAPRARLINEYGPTESSVYSTAWDVPLDPLPTTILIGTSAPHVRCHIVDAFDELAPVNEPGELVVSGRGLADGYLKMSEETAKAFVSDLVAVGERAYRTGDIVRMNDDGQLEWLARKDDQVKVRGVRIELGEVEAGLAQLPGVLEVAAVVRDGRLVGYLAPAVLTEAAALAALAAVLPSSMIPSSIVVLPSLPKSGSDKIDKKRLPSPQPIEEIVTPPRPGLETTIAAIWSEVLQVQSISTTRSFFSYGGHSLTAAVVAARLSQATGQRVPLSLLITSRTVQALAATLSSSPSSPSPPSSPVSSRPWSVARGVRAAARVVIPLQEGGGREAGPVVVFLPGIGGHVFTFAGIAEKLGHRAVGLRAWGAERGETPFSSLAGMAKKNLEALAAAGVTDFALAGYSMGARVAFEMALQMAQAQRRPARLFLFDAMAPGYPAKLPLLERAGLHARSFMGAEGVVGKLSYLQERGKSLRNKLAFATGDAAAFVDEMPDVDPALRPQLERLWGSAALANQAWWPRCTLDVDTTLFVASSPIVWPGHRMDDPLLGWARWVTRPIDTVVLEGLHLELFVAGNHATIATAIDERLRQS